MDLAEAEPDLRWVRRVSCVEGTACLVSFSNVDAGVASYAAYTCLSVLSLLELS